MKKLTWFLDTVDHINEWCGRVIAFVVIWLTFIITFEVIIRYVFNRPTIWGMEVSQMSMLAMICFGVGYTFLHDGHITVTIFYDRLSTKKKAILDLVLYPLVLLVSIVLVWYGGKIFWQNLIYGFKTASAWAPLQWPTKMLVPISGLLLGFQCLAKLIRDWITVWSGVKLESKMVSGNHGK